MLYPAPVERLIAELSKLPGIGPKSAQRLALHLVKAPEAEVESLSAALLDIKKTLRLCGRCFNLSEGELCRICADPRRDPSIVCVVEEARDVISIERTGEFKGLYHVLGGAISPIDGIGPEQLRIPELLRRLREEGVRELIVATNPTVEGEATMLYIAEEARALGVRTTRPASGLPVGGDLEYADEVTLGRALRGRCEV